MPEDKVRKIELPRLDPKEVGLLVIDMQNGFCHPEGARAKAFGVDAIAMPRASIPNVVEMMRLARSAGVRITLTRQVHYPDDQARKRRRIPSHLDRRGVKLELCWRGTWDAELIDEIKAELRPEDDVLHRLDDPRRVYARLRRPRPGRVRLRHRPVRARRCAGQRRPVPRSRDHDRGHREGARRLEPGAGVSMPGALDRILEGAV